MYTFLLTERKFNEKMMIQKDIFRSKKEISDIFVFCVTENLVQHRFGYFFSSLPMNHSKLHYISVPITTKVIHRTLFR